MDDFNNFDELEKLIKKFHTISDQISKLQTDANESLKRIEEQFKNTTEPKNYENEKINAATEKLSKSLSDYLSGLSKITGTFTNNMNDYSYKFYNLGRESKSAVDSFVVNASKFFGPLGVIPTMTAMLHNFSDSFDQFRKIKDQFLKWTIRLPNTADEYFSTKQDQNEYNRIFKTLNKYKDANKISEQTRTKYTDFLARQENDLTNKIEEAKKQYELDKLQSSLIPTKKQAEVLKIQEEKLRKYESQLAAAKQLNEKLKVTEPGEEEEQETEPGTEEEQKTEKTGFWSKIQSPFKTFQSQTDKAAKSAYRYANTTTTGEFIIKLLKWYKAYSFDHNDYFVDPRAGFNTDKYNTKTAGSQTAKSADQAQEQVKIGKENNSIFSKFGKTLSNFQDTATKFFKDTELFEFLFGTGIIQLLAPVAQIAAAVAGFSLVNYTIGAKVANSEKNVNNQLQNQTNPEAKNLLNKWMLTPTPPGHLADQKTYLDFINTQLGLNTPVIGAKPVAGAEQLFQSGAQKVPLVGNIQSVLFNSIVNTLDSSIQMGVYGTKQAANSIWYGIKQSGIAMWDPIKQAGLDLFDVFKTGFMNIVNPMKDIVSETQKSVVGIQDLFTATKQAANSVWNGIKLAGIAMWDPIKQAGLDFFDALKNVFMNIVNPIKDVGGQISKTFGGIQDFFTGKNKGPQLPSVTPQPNPTSVPPKIQIPLSPIPQLLNITPQSNPTSVNNVFAEGGFVKGPGGPKDDKIPAKLSAGEYVIPAEVVKNNQDLIASIDEATTSQDKNIKNSIQKAGYFEPILSKIFKPVVFSFQYISGEGFWGSLKTALTETISNKANQILGVVQTTSNNLLSPIKIAFSDVKNTLVDSVKQTVNKVVNDLFSGNIKDVGKDLVDGVKKLFSDVSLGGQNIFSSIKKGLTDAFGPKVSEAFSDIAKPVSKVVSPIFDSISKVAGPVLEKAGGGIVKFFGGIANVIPGIGGAISAALDILPELPKLWDSIKHTAIGKVLSPVVDSLGSVFDSIGKLLKSIFDNPVFKTIANVSMSLFSLPFKVIADILNTIAGAIDFISNIIKSIVNQIVNNPLVQMIKGVVGTVSNIVGGITNFFTHPFGLAEGGYIVGPGGQKDDKIPARLSSGEYVIPADIVKNNPDLVSQLEYARTGKNNTKKVEIGYHSGGLVQPPDSKLTSLFSSNPLLSAIQNQSSEIAKIMSNSQKQEKQTQKMPPINNISSQPKTTTIISTSTHAYLLGDLGV